VSERYAIYLAILVSGLIGISMLRILDDDVSCYSRWTSPTTCVMHARAHYIPY
jgi:hypothetical protein